MDRGRARVFVVLLVAMSLAAISFQCVSSCVSDACTPPCHSHSHEATVCPVQAITAVLVKAPHIAPDLAMVASVPFSIDTAVAAREAQPLIIASPSSTPPKILILRI
jgi:hypothetical protein